MAGDIFNRMKAYVKKKCGSEPAPLRRQRSGGGGRPPLPNVNSLEPPIGGDPTDEQLAQHLAAYEAARYFHTTAARNVESIMASGLDPAKGGSKDGATNLREQESLKGTVKNIVHVGGDRGNARHYQGELRQWEPETLRVFIDKQQDKELELDNFDQYNHSYRTPLHLQPNQLLRGKFDTASLAQLREIFRIVRTHFPEGSNPPSVDTLIQWHLYAIKSGKAKFHMYTALTTGPGGGRYVSF